MAMLPSRRLPRHDRNCCARVRARLVVRPTTGASATRTITTTADGVRAVAAVRASNGAVSSIALNNTNSIVPAGATKVRVLHLAPNAGTLVFRTQPRLSAADRLAVSVQLSGDARSTECSVLSEHRGTWEVRIWQTPADASGWANAPVKVVIQVSSGQKTVVILKAARRRSAGRKRSSVAHARPSAAIR